MGFGFLGALLGIWLGHRFDRALQATLGRQVFSQEIFFLATFEVMGHIAKADGHVSKDEIAVAARAMDQLGFDAGMRQQAIAAFDRGKSTAFQLEVALAQLQASLLGNPTLLQLFVDFQLKMAEADGIISPRERQILERIGAYFNLSGFHERSPQGSRNAGMAAAYQTLGVAPQATPEEIKKAYRRKMRAHHPDRLIAKGLPEAMIKLATEKTQAIQKAYEAIKKQRGL
jgi:DnaJ like chaperone protein